MEWDLGFWGLGLLLAMSIVFGFFAQLVMWRMTTHWLWIIATMAYFVSGLFVSEVLFGWATEEDLQPNVDGLSFDEVLLLATITGIITILLTWRLSQHARTS